MSPRIDILVSVAEVIAAIEKPIATNYDLLFHLNVHALQILDRSVGITVNRVENSLFYIRACIGMRS
jgi:hypothetical protein